MTGHDQIPSERERSPFDPAPRSAAGTVRRWLTFTVLVAGGVAGAWWFTRARSVPNAAGGATSATADANGGPVMLSPESAKRIGVTYAAVERGPLVSEVRTVGLVAYDETKVKAITPKVDGYVEQLFVSFTGQPVEEGDPLLRLYSPMLVTAQEELLLARQLVADVAHADADAVRNAESMLAGARRRLKYWDVPDADVARLERTGEVQKTLTLRSPLRGVLVQKNVLSGQRIMAGDGVYQVADLREVWLEGEVFERDLGSVHLGQAVAAEFTFEPGAPRDGRITYIAPSITPETRTAKIRVAMLNLDGALKPGMYATIRIRGDARAGVLSVPRGAVLMTGTRVFVFVKGADGMLTPREVELGGNTDERVEIRRGVAEGETVVASATFLVDAESNLGAAMAAMANMPGMDMGAPKAAPGAKSADPMADMPGMDHSTMPGMDHSKMPGMVPTPKKP